MKVTFAKLIWLFLFIHLFGFGSYAYTENIFFGVRNDFIHIELWTSITFGESILNGLRDVLNL